MLLLLTAILSHSVFHRLGKFAELDILTLSVIGFVIWNKIFNFAKSQFFHCNGFYGENKIKLKYAKYLIITPNPDV